MLWFRAPEKVYIKKGCLPVALRELKEVLGKKKVFIVTDSFLYHNGYTKAVTDRLDEMGKSPTPPSLTWRPTPAWPPPRRARPP